MSSKIAFLCQNLDLKKPSQILAKKFNKNLIFCEDSNYDAFLYLNKRALLDMYLRSWKTGKTLGLDFTEHKKIGLKNKLWSLKSLLPKALALDKHLDPVLDITAGFCNDSFILSSLGVRVCALEQSHVIFSLVEAALQKAENKEPFKLLCTNALDYMQELIHLDQRPKLIYMDPMFEIASRTALSNKSMQALQLLESYTKDLQQKNVDLLQKALLCASHRVVVKRNKKTASLKKPSYTLHGKLLKYDVYLIKTDKPPS